MQINDFGRYSFTNQCPICRGNNTSKVGNPSGMSLRRCNSCNGVPAFCNGSMYVHSGNNADVCENCGERDPSTNTHALQLSS